MATWKGEDDPRLVLARRLYKETKDQDMVAKGMRSLGYGREESAQAAAHVAPKTSPRSQTPPGGGGRATGQATPRQRASQPATPTPPSGGGGLSDWFGGGKVPSPTLRLPTKPTSTQVVGFGFGLIGYVLFITYLRYGGPGVKGWFGAKLLNVPYNAPAAPLDGSAEPNFGNPAPPGNPNPNISPSTGSSTDPGAGNLTSTRPHHHRHHHHARSDTST